MPKKLSKSPFFWLKEEWKRFLDFHVEVMSFIDPVIVGRGLALEKGLGDFGTMISGEKIGNGRDAARAYMSSHPDIANDLESKLRVILKGAPAASEDGVIETPASDSSSEEK